MKMFSGMIIVRSKEQHSKAKPVVNTLEQINKFAASLNPESKPDFLCQKPGKRYQQLVFGESSWCAT